MRLTEAVRIGGRLALVIGFVFVNLVFGDSLNYYYGYSNASFGVQQAVDPFTAQNVSFTPQVALVSSTQNTESSSTSVAAPTTTAAFTSGGFGVLATVYGYAAPATTTDTSPVVNWNSISYSTPSAPTATAMWNTTPTSTSTSGASTGSYYSTPVTSFDSSGVNWGAFATPVTYQATPTSAVAAPMWAPVSSSAWGGSGASSSSSSASGFVDFTSGFSGATGWSAVSMSVIPRVTTSVTTSTGPVPSATPTVVLTTPALNLDLPATGVPEPATLFSIPAGLLLLAFRLRRK
jgi:hypothetical protein